MNLQLKDFILTFCTRFQVYLFCLWVLLLILFTILKHLLRIHFIPSNFCLPYHHPQAKASHLKSFTLVIEKVVDLNLQSWTRDLYFNLCKRLILFVHSLGLFQVFESFLFLKYLLLKLFLVLLTWIHLTRSTLPFLSSNFLFHFSLFEAAFQVR